MRSVSAVKKKHLLRLADLLLSVLNRIIVDNVSMFYQVTWVCVCLFCAQGVGGAVQYPKNYLKEAYKLVRERGGVCIADEVRFTLCDLIKRSAEEEPNRAFMLNCRCY